LFDTFSMKVLGFFKTNWDSGATCPWVIGSRSIPAIYCLFDVGCALAYNVVAWRFIVSVKISALGPQLFCCGD